MPKRSLEIVTTSFNFWVFLNSFFTNVGSIVLVYANYKTQTCRFGAVITAVVLQGVGLLICLGAVTFTTGKEILKQSRNPNNQREKKNVSTLYLMENDTGK